MYQNRIALRRKMGIFNEKRKFTVLLATKPSDLSTILRPLTNRCLKILTDELIAD